MFYHSLTAFTNDAAMYHRCTVMGKQLLNNFCQHLAFTINMVHVEYVHI